MTNAEAIFDLEQFALAPIGDGDLHRESVELALSALREQAERDKGCEYCKQVIATVKMDFETDSILGENKWFSSTRRPKYCPMCGRRLEEHHE